MVDSPKKMTWRREREQRVASDVSNSQRNAMWYTAELHNFVILFKVPALQPLTLPLTCDSYHKSDSIISIWFFFSLFIFIFIPIRLTPPHSLEWFAFNFIVRHCSSNSSAYNAAHKSQQKPDPISTALHSYGTSNFFSMWNENEKKKKNKFVE